MEFKKTNQNKFNPIPSMYKATPSLSAGEERGGWGVGGAGHLSSHRPLSSSVVAGNPAAKWPGTWAGFQGGGYCWEEQGWASSAPAGLRAGSPFPW